MSITSVFKVNAPTLKMVSAMVLAGSIGIFVVESGEPALTVVFYRCLIGGAALLIYCIFANRNDFAKLTGRNILMMSLSGLTMAANWVLFFMAYSHASISMVTTVYHVYPFVLLFASAAVFREKIFLRSIGWAICAFVGVVFVARGNGQGAEMSLVGLGLTMSAMIFYAATLLITKHLTVVPASLLSLVQLLIGAFVLLPLTGTSGLHVGTGSWGLLLTIGIVHTGLLYVLLYDAVQSLETSRIVILSFLYPLTALIFDVAVYAVRPDGMQITGLALITFAVLGEKLKFLNSKTENSI
jgi:drug/metabolite transporter (DMT)-like permease